MTATALFVASGVAFVLSLSAGLAMVPLLTRRGVLDIPNERSSHERPVPRGGGVGIVAGIIGGCVVLWVAGVSPPSWVVVSACAAMGVLGAVEDLGGELSPGMRLVTQLVVASGVVWALGPISRLPLPAPLDVSLGLLAWPFTLIWIVSVTNIFNFLDGIDGYAGFQGVVAGAAMAFIGFGWIAGVGAVAAAACAGFLVHNWHPARIFMGDVGSVALGFLFGILPLGLGGESHIGVFVMGMALWFFLADGTFTILRRLCRREKIWQAHRSHLYQRLTIAGWSHSRVVLTLAGGVVLVTAVVVAGVTSGSAPVQWAGMGAALVLFVGYWTIVARVEHRARQREQIEH